IVVKDMVFAHIGMRQDVVAEGLRVAQTGAMAEHQPGMRPEDGDMIRNRLGVGWTYTNIDHAYAGMTRLDQMIGGHLRYPRRRNALLRSSLTCRGDDIAWLDQLAVAAAAFGHQLASMIA